jgi:hypothetical protein
LNGERFDSETTRIMGVAFETARIAMLLTRHEPVDAIIAKRIIELAKTGERNPDVLVRRHWKRPPGH